MIVHRTLGDVGDQGYGRGRRTCTWSGGMAYRIGSGVNVSA